MAALVSGKLEKSVLQLMENRDQLTTLEKNALRMARPEAGSLIADEVMKLI